MADFDPAWTFTQQFEDDPRHPGRVTIDSNGARVCRGMNEASNPELWRDIPQGGAPTLEGCKATACNRYWLPWCLFAVDDQELANRIFDCTFNSGEQREGEILQTALAGLGYIDRSQIDGFIGRITINAANRACLQGKGAALIDSLRAQRVAFLEAWAAKNPQNEKYLAGLLTRAEA
ncbi:MAG: putative peptidoglycan-binding domain-containing protein [Candidatus Acidiferrales bacterium]